MNETSFRTDVLPLKNELFRLALRITLNRAEAEDVVQDTLLKVWSRREQWGTIDSMEAFCLTICRNLALDRQRRHDRQNAPLDPAHEATDTSFSANPEAQTVLNDRLDMARRLMQQLPEKQRSCMQLRDVEGKSYRDIATIMGISEQQVKVNIFRARQALRQRLIENENYGL